MDNEKRILAVKGRSDYNVLRYAADEICKGFQRCGYQVDMIDVLEEGATERILACLANAKEYAFYFSMQALFWDLEQGELPELQGIRRVGWLVDAPVYHSARLYLCTGRDAYVLTTQHSHTEEIRREYPYFERVETLYHGGFLGNKRIDYSDKNIDVFFPGTYFPVEEAEKEIDRIEGVFGMIARKVKERLAGGNTKSSWETELKSCLKEIDFEISDKEFQTLLEVMYPLDAYQRSCIRKSIVDELLAGGIELTVVGKGWEKYEGSAKERLHILSHEGVDITEVIGLMQRSKIVLNNMNFLDGMHERIFTAMLAKAVCVTNEFELLNELFADGRELVTYPLNRLEILPRIVKELLEDTEKAKRIAEAGYRAAVHSHTWEHRGEQIARWMEDGQDFVYERLCECPKSSI